MLSSGALLCTVNVKLSNVFTIVSSFVKLCLDLRSFVRFGKVEVVLSTVAYRSLVFVCYIRVSKILPSVVMCCVCVKCCEDV